MIEITKLSSKGQVVIPREIREFLKLDEGMLLSATIQDNSVCLKKIEIPKIKTWAQATEPFRNAAKKSGFKKEDLDHLIAESKSRL